MDKTYGNTVRVKKAAKSKSAHSGDNYVVAEQVGHLLRKAYQRHLAIFGEIAAETPLTSVQFVTLCMLEKSGDCSQAELVRATAVDQATIRGVVDRLKARGLVALKKDAHDGRKVVIGLTSKGGDLLEEMYPKAHAITEATVSNLNPAERVALNFLLRKMMGETASED
jgi:MarR family transcriptional regulator, lower aerobic nicotinate degradation pathway regulator